ncbi:hypothetical protein G9A89_011983 [Geosiphon pyriformis]|nr:hypothetical protein G9A89_011983 [Geosiphon pyriformis]
MIAKETSYTEFDNLVVNENMDDTMSQKTHTRMYMLGQPSKGLVFSHMSNVNDDDAILLLLSNFSGSKCLPLAELRVLEKRSFNLTKSFTLDIELSAMLELSLKRARELTIYEKIVTNNDVRQVNKLSDRVIVVKKILVDLPKLAVESVFFKFGRVVSIKMQLIGLWQKALVEFESSEIADLVAAKWSVFIRKNSVCVAKAVEDKQLWIFRDLHRALLYTFPVGTIAHDLSDLLESYGGKTCFIGCNLSSYVHDRCVIVCFGNKASKLAAISSVLVYKDVNLRWAGLSLACYAKCKQLDHISMKCSLVAGGSLFRVVSSVSFGAGVSSDRKSSSLVSSSFDVSGLNDCLAALECSLELLADQVLDILKRLNGVELVPLAFFFCVSLPAASVPKMSVSNSDMLVDSMLASSDSLPSNVDVSDAGFGFSISKVLTIKMGGLKSKLSALDAFVENVVHWHKESGNMMSFVTKTKLHSSIKPWIADRFDGVHIFTSGVEKMIDYIFVSKNLLSAVADHKVASVSDFFNTDHRAVVVSVGLGGLLDVCLNSLHKQTNRNCWKFKIKNAGCAQWAKFKNLLLVKFMLLDKLFSGAELRGDKAVVVFADVTFSRHWFNKFRYLKKKHSSKFFGLELLVTKIVKVFCSDDLSEVNHLVNRWSTLDDAKAHVFDILFCLSVKSEVIVKHLSLVCRDYRRSKMFESRLAEEASIRKAIERHMKNFCSDKISMIRNVLDRPFHKMVFNHLVIDNKLILEPKKMKLSVEKIMERWTRKHSVLSYVSLEYVWNDAFSSVMCAVNINKLLPVVFSLPNSKAAGGSEMSVKAVKCVFDCWFGACFVERGNGVLTNTQLIVLIETARKILSKILSDHILVACSKFNVLQDDNFSVLKGTSTQSLVFAVGSVVKNALEKNKKNMRKVYNSVGWHHLRASLQCIKMCDRFIRFFGGIHKDRVNRMITDFGLSGGYRVHDGLDQASIQYALNITSEFFEVNNISINSEKTVAIPINQGIKVTSLSICEQPISIAKKNEVHHYLSIFLSTEGLSKPNVIKAHADIRFFVNVMLRKAITNKQFLYLVLAVLQPIVSYYIQFSFVSSSVCRKSKACLLHNFPDVALHHLSLYGLKPFEQVQSERKVAALIMFSNAPSILKHLFSHRFLDLQVLGWASLDSLQFSVRLCVSPVNNFLAGLVKIFLDNKLSLTNNLPTVFHSSGHFFLFSILRKSLYFDLVKSLKCFGVAFGNWLFDKKDGLLDWKTFCYWKRLDLCGSVPHWFMVASKFFLGKGFSSSGTPGSFELHRLDVLGFSKFSTIKDGLHNVWLDFFEVYTDGSLKNAGSAKVVGGAAAYFLGLDLSIGVVVWGLLFSIMAKLQAVALSLECVPSSSTVVLYLDSQTAIDTCVSKMSLVTPDFYNQCWLERCHIFNLVRDKDLNVSWAKVKSYSGIPGNVRADLAAGTVSGSPFLLLANMHKHFLVAKSTAVFEAGPGCNVVPDVMLQVFDTLFLYDESCAQEITGNS